MQGPEETLDPLAFLLRPLHALCRTALLKRTSCLEDKLVLLRELEASSGVAAGSFEP